MNWRDIFFKNYQAKTALLLMAIFLWLFVVTSRDYTQILNVPIELINLKENKVFLNNPPQSAQVRFHGKGRSLLILSLFGDAHFKVDISSINYYYNYPLRLEQLQWASGIDVTAMEIIAPDTIHIRIDDVIERTLKVKPMLTVTPAKKYIITQRTQTMPDTVVIRGAKSVLEDLKYVPTEAKSIAKATGPVNVVLNVIVPDKGIVSVEPNVVRAVVQVEKIETRTLNNVPVQVIHCEPDKPGIAVPGTVTIKVIGAASLLKEMDRNSVLISVSAKGTPSEAGGFRPVVHLPENVELVEMIPDSVMIEYRSNKP